MARVITKFFFLVRVSMHQSGQSIARSVNSSVKITKATQWPQMLGSLGLGFVDLSNDQRRAWPHSGHCHLPLSAVLPLNFILRLGVGNALPLRIT
jgi:hypothetical protein